MTAPRRSEFEELSAQKGDGNILTDFWYMFRYSRKYWLMPLVVILLLLGALMMLSGTAVAPFIYTLF